MLIIEKGSLPRPDSEIMGVDILCLLKEHEIPKMGYNTLSVIMILSKGSEFRSMRTSPNLQVHRPAHSSAIDAPLD